MDINVDFAEIPLLIRCHRSGYLSKVHALSFIDPTDGEAYDDTQLSEVERGNVYRYAAVGAGRVLVAMPYKVFDSGAFLMVGEYESLRAEPPYSIPLNTIPAGALRNIALNPGLIWQRFSLSSGDFEDFMRCGLQLEWGFHRGIVSVEALSAKATVIQNEAKAVLSGVEALTASIGQLNTQDDLTAACERLEQLSFAAGAISSRDMLAEFADSVSLMTPTERELLNELGNGVAAFIAAVKNVNWTLLNRRLVDGYRVAAGIHIDPAEAAVAITVELDAFRAAFPAARNLRVEGENLAVVLPGCTILLQPGGGFEVRGDVSALQTRTVEAVATLGTRLRMPTTSTIALDDDEDIG